MVVEYLFKDKFFYVFLALVLLVIPITGADFCYQEFANVTTACGGLAGGNYTDTGWWASQPGRDAYDGSWATNAINLDISGFEFIYMNYSKPLNSLSSSLWQVKDDNSSNAKNLSLNSSCFAQSNLQLRFASNKGADEGNWSCRNSSAWTNVFHYEDTSPSPYEEAIFWDLAGDPPTNQSSHTQIYDSQKTSFFGTGRLRFYG